MPTTSAFDDDEQGPEVLDASGEVVELSKARSRRGQPPTRPGEVDPKEWEVAIDDEADPDNDDNDNDSGTGVVAVDPAEALDTVPESLRGRLEARKADRQPIVAPWLRDRSELRYAGRWAAGHVAHTTLYHAARTPKYAGRIAGRAPVGAAKVTGHAVRWISDAEGRPLRHAAVTAEDPEVYLRLSKQRLERMRWRLLVAAMLLAGLTAGIAAVKFLTPGWAHWLALFVVAGVLAIIGTSADKPLLDVPQVTPRARKLSADIVQRAIVATGLAKTPDEVVFPAPIVRDGPGWRATIDLPHGTTAGDVVARRDKLASGLDLALGQVWPEGTGTGGSVRRLVLWVGDEDLSQAKPHPWPLLKRGSVDLFREFPFGTDQRGNPVLMCLMFISLLVAAIPRMGKTFAARLVVLAAALDPSVELHVYDFKGGSDWMCFEPVAHRFGVGDEPDVINAVVTDLRELRDEMVRRYKVLRGLPSDICPESKVTRELADKKSLRLHPIVLSMDECQRSFEHAEHGAEITDLITDLVKRGPAVAIIVVLATQKPDKDSLPSGIRDNVGMRFGMRVMTWQVSDMVLGSGMNKAGFNAAALTRADRGIGYLVGASDDIEAQLARADFIDSTGATTVITRARALREAAGTITGYAAGEATDIAPSFSILDDVASVLGDEPKVWSETVVTRLAEIRPDVYDGWNPAQLAGALKKYGISTSQVWGTDPNGKGVNRRGITREDVLNAVLTHNKTKQPLTPSTNAPDTAG